MVIRPFHVESLCYFEITRSLKVVSHVGRRNIVFFLDAVQSIAIDITASAVSPEKLWSLEHIVTVYSQKSSSERRS